MYFRDSKKTYSKVILLLFLTLFFSACSQSRPQLKGNSSSGEGTNLDRLEKYNRKIFKFNTALDKLFLKPVATAYKKITP